jgi:hypothetical protein
MQEVYIFEGPDMTGKTNIAKAFASQMRIPYYKNTRDASAFSKGSTREEFVLGMSKWADPYLIDFLQQTGYGTILDRNYPSEWVYSRCFNRETNDELTMNLDDGFSKLGATIILCRRRSYEGITDDIFPDQIKEEQLQKLDKLYEDFSKITKCKVVTIWTDDFECVSNGEKHWNTENQSEAIFAEITKQRQGVKTL